MSPLVQNILIVGGLLLILGVGYFLYTQNSTLDTSNNAMLTNQAAVETAEFLRRLNELKAIELDGQIFSDPRFSALLDYTSPVLSEPIGNTNPFEVSN